MNPRKTGLAMVVAGALAQAMGLVLHSASGTTRELLDLGVPSHALFFSGVAIAVLGVALALTGPVIYAPSATPGRRFAQVLIPVVAFAGVAGCASAANKETAAKAGGASKVASGSTTTAHDMSKMDETDPAHDHGGSGSGSKDDHAVGSVITETATGDSPCEKAGKPASPGQANAAGDEGTDAEGGHGHRGMLKQQSVTNEERKLLIEQMAQARSVTVKYPTVKDAEAAGYKKSTVFLPCIGAHYTNLGLVVKFDPAAPSELLFDGTEPDSKIIGLSYLVYNQVGPPEGFAGPNDAFHQHNANGGLCLKGTLVVAGENSTDAECKAAGGEKGGEIMKHIWMAHAWVAPGWECSWGVFAGECPELGGKIGGGAFDKS